MAFGNINSKDFINKALIIAGILTILTACFTYYAGKKNIQAGAESKFSSPMIALELSSTKDEVLNIMGRSLSTEIIKSRKALNLQNFYDSIFLFTYPFFLALVFLFFYKANVNTPYREMIMGLGLALCFIMFISNIFENTQIYKLTTAFSVNTINESTLSKLIISSRLKFTAIFMSCMVLAGNYIILIFHDRYLAPKLLLQLYAALYMASGITGYLSVVIKGANFFVENCLVYVAVCWLLTLVHVLTITLFGKKAVNS